MSQNTINRDDSPDTFGETDELSLVFDSLPQAIFTAGKDYIITRTNRQFRGQFPRYLEGERNICYRVIPPFERDNPCDDCLLEKTFLTGKPASREIRSLHAGSQVHYKLTTSPVRSADGRIIAVLESIDDITHRIQAEKRIEKYSWELEASIHQKIGILRDKEKKLTALVNTVHELKSAHNMNESIRLIIEGYKSLRVKAIAFALFSKDDMYIAAVHPERILIDMNEMLGLNLMGIHLHPKRSPRNPFVHTAQIGKPLFYRGEQGMRDFFISCNITQNPETLEKTISLFRDTSLVIFPLKTKSRAEGAIGIFADGDVLEENYEYYNFLANSSAVEISRQKSSENLIRSEIKYRNLVENSRDMILLCDKDGDIRFANKTFYSRTGLTANMIKTHNIYSFFSHRDKNRLREVIGTCLDEGGDPEPFELKMNVPASKDLWSELTISRYHDPRAAFQIVSRDISKRKKMEDLIGNLTAFQEKIVQNDFIGIISMDLSRKITSLNRGATNILGYREPDLLGKSINDIIRYSPIASLDPAGKLVSGLKSGHPASRELMILNRRGAPVNVMYAESALKDERGRDFALVAFFLDITEKARLEEKSRELNIRLNQAQMMTILSLAKLTEYRDIETGSHLERIMRYTEVLAREMATFAPYKDYITEEYILDLVNSCPLHDIGKVGIPDSILHKPGKLTKEEYEIMKNHTIIGGNTIMEAEKKVEGRSYLNLGKEIAYYHHERWDGSGYPKGLRGIDIPLSARIVALSDVYDALTSQRPYKDAYSHEVALHIIVKSANSHFDENVVRAFLNREKEFLQCKLLN